MHASRAPGPEGVRSGPGFVFLCHRKVRRSVTLPGVQISAIQGAGPQPGDFPLLTSYGASIARALLDNLTPSRSVKGVSRTLTRAEIEQWLEKVCDQEGESHLNRIRDQARLGAPALGLQVEFAQLDQLIGALLGTRIRRNRCPCAPHATRYSGSHRVAEQHSGPCRLLDFAWVKRRLTEAPTPCLAGTASLKRRAAAGPPLDDT